MKGANFGLHKKNALEKYNNDFITIDMSSTTKLEKINYKAWSDFLSYYRCYIDEFAINILGCKIFSFQRLILRAMIRYQNSMLICCRGLGKSYISALFMICMAILYPRNTNRNSFWKRATSKKCYNTKNKR
jgi:hypothetical protein